MPNRAREAPSRAQAPAPGKLPASWSNGPVDAPVPRPAMLSYIRSDARLAWEIPAACGPSP